MKDVVRAEQDDRGDLGQRRPFDDSEHGAGRSLRLDRGRNDGGSLHDEWLGGGRLHGWNFHRR